VVIPSADRTREAGIDRAREDRIGRELSRNRTSLTAAAEEIVTGAQRRPTPL